MVELCYKVVSNISFLNSFLTLKDLILYSYLMWSRSTSARENQESQNQIKRDCLPGEKNSSVMTGERKSSFSIDSKSLISNWGQQYKFLSKVY